MIQYVSQYKLIFLVLWIISYIIYPSWALPVSEISRHVIVAGLLTYFAISTFFLNRWLYVLNVDKPIIIQPKSWLSIIKNHSELVVVCLIAVILHVYPVVTRPILIIGDEALHLHGGLWIYKFIDIGLHKYFQIVFWVLMGLIILLRTRKNLWKYICESFSRYLSSSRATNYSIIAIFCIAAVYYIFLQNWDYYPHMIRYPPLSRLMYLVLYSAFGINHLWPRMLQVAFYLLGAIYLYRTILLYGDKHTALFGAAIFLFTPVTFAYSTLAYLSSGTVLFVILVSYYFLRFLENKDSRDIILASFFIGAGFLYKRGSFLLVFICAAYLIYCRIKDKDLNLPVYLQGMILTMVPIVPWMLIGKYFTWRNYTFTPSNFIPPHGKIYSYFTQIQSDMSWIIFTLFIISIIFILKRKKDHLTQFFLFLFISYYLLFALDLGNKSPRLAMVFNPAISVFIALFLSYIVSKIRWKYSFRMIFVVLLAYLIAISTVPSLNAKYLKSVEMKKLQPYPSEEAMNWVRDNIKVGERILTLRIMTAPYYRDKYKIDYNKIIDFWYELDEVATPEKLQKVCVENGVTHIMFPYGAVYDGYFPILKYLKENNKNEFIKVTEFNIGDNSIFIYKLDENFKQKNEKLGKTWKEPVSGIEFIRIHGGCYEMGDNFGDGEGSELPIHPVCVDDFYLGKYEVTQKQWMKVMNINRSKFKGCDDCPVEMVSWNDVQGFIKNLNNLTGKRFRLPTEAEWEYAARSGGGREKFAGFSEGDTVYKYGNFCDINCEYRWKEIGQDDGHKNTSPVGSYRPNGLGLYDMSGNVWEWINDWFDEKYYGKSPNKNPTGPTSGTYNVLRGGSWGGTANNSRASNRDRARPTERDNSYGFRLALSIQ